LWNAKDTEIPSIEAQLIPASGPAIAPDFTITGANTGTFTSSTIPTGYHTLTLKLLDNGLLTMGAVEVVRIIKDQTTSGTFGFYDINEPGGTIGINITPDMAEPIDVTITGQLEEIEQGSTMTVTASVPEGTGNVVYVWYINGESVETGESYAVSGFPIGVYRLDVTAFTVDGKRAGSTNCMFNVLAETIGGDIVSVAAGDRHSLAIKNDGTLWAWGWNVYGQLGDGTTTARHSLVQVMEDVVSVAAGYRHSFAIKNDGTVWAWGHNYYGQLGDGTTTDRHSPVQVMEGVISITPGHFSTFAIKNDGTLWAWGQNIADLLGDGTITDRHNPMQVMEDVASVAAGFYHTLVIKNDDTLWAWGANDYGQLGDGTTTGRYSPVQVLEDVVSVAAGFHHTLAVRNDGRLWTWGHNDYGQLGDGTTTDRHSPVQVMEDVVSVGAGILHSLAFKNDGTLWAWGFNEHGQYGDGTTTQRHSPVQALFP
jgi:hypothetical protein